MAFIHSKTPFALPPWQFQTHEKNSRHTKLVQLFCDFIERLYSEQTLRNILTETEQVVLLNLFHSPSFQM